MLRRSFHPFAAAATLLVVGLLNISCSSPISPGPPGPDPPPSGGNFVTVPSQTEEQFRFPDGSPAPATFRILRMTPKAGSDIRTGPAGACNPNSTNCFQLELAGCISQENASAFSFKLYLSPNKGERKYHIGDSTQNDGQPCKSYNTFDEGFWMEFVSNDCCRAIDVVATWQEWADNKWVDRSATWSAETGFH